MPKLLLLTSFPSLDFFFTLQEILKFYKDNDLRPEHEPPSTWLKTWLFRNSIRCSCIHNAFVAWLSLLQHSIHVVVDITLRAKKQHQQPTHELISSSEEQKSCVHWKKAEERNEIQATRANRLSLFFILHTAAAEFFPVWHIYLISCWFYCCALSLLMHATIDSFTPGQPASTRCMETLFCDKFIVVPFELSWADEALFFCCCFKIYLSKQHALLQRQQKFNRK